MGLSLNTRLGLLTGLLFLVCLVCTRFVPATPLAFSSAVAPVLHLAHRVGLNIHNALVAIEKERGLSSENLELRTRVADLETERARLQNEVQRLKRAAAIREKVSPSVELVAPVVAVNQNPLTHTITIGKGSRDGVMRMMPVTTPEGLVGLVDEVLPDKALVRTLVDPRIEIGVTVRGVRAGQALARGVPGLRLEATGFKRVQIKIGAEIWTSNAVGSVFPLVKVGTVERVIAGNASRIGQTVVIAPEVDISTLEEVYLLRQP